MAEIGLVQYARIALPIAQAVVPAYRSKYSKHTFTQPQLLVILCLMRYEDWTFRETEVCLAEHTDLREALQLEALPDYKNLYRFMRRLNEKLIEKVLKRIVQQFREPNDTSQATVAVDGTGLAPGAISTFFVNRRTDRGHGLPWRHWLKWLLVVDTVRQLIIAQRAQRGPYNGSATLRPLVDAAAQVEPIGLVIADGEFDSELNHQHVRRVLNAKSIIPAKRGKRTWHIHGIRAQMRKRFPRKRYGQRALIETVFSVVKRKLSARAPGRSKRSAGKPCCSV
jgi:hypothetical protein